MSPLAIPLLLAFGSVSAPLPDQAVYKWKFEKGTSFYLSVTVEGDQKVKVEGVETVVKHRQTTVFCFTPVKQDGDEWVLRQTVEAMRSEMDLGGHKLTFDSTRPELPDHSQDLAKLYRALVGWECRLTLDGDRKVTRLEGADELAKRYEKENPGSASPVGLVLTEDMLREMTSQYFNALPGRRVEKGESWVRTQRTDMGPLGRCVNSYEYGYGGKDGKLEKFTVVSAETKYHPPAPGAADPKLPYTLKKADIKSQKAGGFLLFDPVRGRLDRSELSLEVEAALEIEIGGKVTPMTTTQTQKTTVQVSAVNPVTSMRKQGGASGP